MRAVSAIVSLALVAGEATSTTAAPNVTAATATTTAPVVSALARNLKGTQPRRRLWNDFDSCVENICNVCTNGSGDVADGIDKACGDDGKTCVMDYNPNGEMGVAECDLTDNDIICCPYHEVKNEKFNKDEPKEEPYYVSKCECEEGCPVCDIFQE